MQSLAKDLYGPFGGPCESGFEISTLTDPANDFNISGGHYYVDGILCEVEGATTYRNQPDPPIAEDKKLVAGNYLVYLDVWERHITPIEDDSIREVALGGPDTATRAQVVWQVKATSQDPDGTAVLGPSPLDPPGNWREWVHAEWSKWRDQWQPANRGMLKAQAKKSPKDDTDPCITSPESRYRGAENQLYRVEIHREGEAWDVIQGNGGQAGTFKWSRENSSVAAAWVDTDGDKLTVIGIRDVTHGFAAGQWVELTHGEGELLGKPGIMVKLVKVEGEVLTIDPATQQIPSDPSVLIHPKVRRWDHSCEQKALGAGQAKVAKPHEGALLIEEGQWLTLEDGVQIYFESTAENHRYRTGDYWLIPARTATGDVEWPGSAGNPDPLPPHGIEHHYAPLAIINVDGTGEVKLADAADADLRSRKRLNDCSDRPTIDRAALRSTNDPPV